jgi:hypothetical protein
MRRPHSRGFSEHLVEGHALVGTRAEFFEPLVKVGTYILVRARFTFEAIDQEAGKPCPLGNGKRKCLLGECDISDDHICDRKRMDRDFNCRVAGRER